MKTRSVAIIGAGPAGLFAARELAQNGVDVFLFNRDIRPGGLAEYGIYPTKYRLKTGFRKQIMGILNNEHIHYYGNMEVGVGKDISLDELKEMGFKAILVTAGAQKIKRLGLEGESLPRVYHAWEIVSKYNDLPPFSQMEYPIGKKVLIVGVGNVMADIARYLITQRGVEEVLAVARRGPAEIKFHQTEFAHIAQNLDREDFEQEMGRVSPLMLRLGQDPNNTWAFIEKACENCEDTGSDALLRLRFLKSPLRFIGDEENGLQAVECVENTLVRENGYTKPVKTSTRTIFEVDTAILAVGSSVDGSIGLPVDRFEFKKSTYPSYPQEGISYELVDEKDDENIEGIFVAGWSRLSSYGLVGISGKDGVRGAQAVLEYLEDNDANLDFSDIDQQLHARKEQIIDKNHIEDLLSIEREVANQKGVTEYKFATNEEMLAAIGLV